jgi:RNA recognition motif-containing protein
MNITQKELQSRFAGFGKIISSRFRSLPLKSRYRNEKKLFGVMHKDFVEGIEEAKLTQNAYIVFESEESVSKAVESGTTGTDLFKSGHLVRLDYVSKSASITKKFDRKKSVYIPHVPAVITDSDIIASVEGSDESLRGAVRGVRIVKDKKGGKFAFVLFSERSHATKCIKMKSGGFFPNQTKQTEIKYERILKDEEIQKEKQKELEEVKKRAEKAAKNSLSRMKWQNRLANKGSDKVVTYHAMPRAERNEKIKGAMLRIQNKNFKKSKNN